MKSPWTIIAVRSVGAAEWDALPGAKLTPAVAQSLVNSGRAMTRVKNDGRRELLEVCQK